MLPLLSFWMSASSQLPSQWSSSLPPSSRGFGKIAATNALSDVYAMGGEVKTAMNIVCFPQSWDINMLGEILRGGSEKVIGPT